MLNRRFTPYPVVVGLIALLSVCHIGYREYQKHVEFERFISGTEAFNHSVEHTDQDEHIHLTEAHTHAGGNPDPSTTADTTNPYYKGKQGDEYVYMAGGKYIYSVAPLDQEYLELQAWVITGEKTPYVEKHLKRLAENSPYKGQVVQRIVTPDGQLHNVIVPHGWQYEEGDAILRSELDPPILEAFEQDQRPARVEIAGEPIPDEYYAIKDPYERQEFIKKVMFSKQLKISMAALEAKIVKGEIDVSLSAREKENVDNNEAMEERERILKSFARPVPSDKPPVKVSFLPDEGEDALPVWTRKMERNPQLGNDEIGSGAAYSTTAHDDVRGAPVRSDLPHFPADLSRVVEPVSQDIADLQKRLMPEGVGAKLEQSVSPDRFDEMQRLIKQYGTEEGLRRLREVAPEAARRSESDKSRPGRERLRSGSPRPSEPSRDAPEGEQSEQ